MVVTEGRVLQVPGDKAEFLDVRVSILSWMGRWGYRGVMVVRE